VQQGADEAAVIAEPGRGDMRPEQYRLGVEMGEHKRQIARRQADAAANGDGVETENGSEVGNKPGDGFGRAPDDRIACIPLENGPRIGQIGRCRDGPPAGDAFDRAETPRPAERLAQPGGGEADMAGKAAIAVDKPAAEHQAAADAGGDGQIGEIVGALPRPETAFGQGRRGGIVDLGYCWFEAWQGREQNWVECHLGCVCRKSRQRLGLTEAHQVFRAAVCHPQAARSGVRSAGVREEAQRHDAELAG
jgi:hypothetical protein